MRQCSWQPAAVLLALFPVPSRSSSTTSLVSLVARSTRAVRVMGSVSQAVVGGDLTQRGEEGVGLGRDAGGDPEPAGDADVADEDVAGEQRPAGGPRGGGARREAGEG